MSNTSDGDKREPGKVFPMDLAAKVAIMKSPDSSKNPSLVMTASGTQQLRTITQPQQVRVLTQAVASSVNPITTSTGGPTVISTHIVPQAMLKQVESGRTQIAALATSSSQSSLAASLTRPTQITLATASPGGTYHVPRGPAAVANMAAPRATVATTVRGVTVSPQPIGAIVRGVAPPRTPSPSSTISVIPSGASWHGTTVQVQSAQPSGNKVAVTSPLLSPQQRTSGTAVPIVQGRAQVVGRTQPNISGQPRPTLLHTAVTVVGNQPGTQIHTFKSAGGTVQTLPTSVTLAQVVPSSRTQTLVYSSVSSGQHLTAAPRLAVASNVTQQRQVTTGRSVQLSGPRLATPVSGATVHLTGPARLTVAQNTVLATGARISTIPTGQANVIGSAARITVTQPSNIGRLTITTTASQATILTTTPARLGQSVAGQTSATVLTTPTGRIQANVVSLHPVMVSNTSQPQLNLTQTRTLQGQGPKVITQPAHGAIQIAQVATVGKIGTQQQATVVPVSVAVGANRTVTVASGAVIGQRSISVAPNQQTVPLAKVFPQSTARTSIEASEIPSSAGGQAQQQQQQTANVYIPRASPGPNSSQVQPVSTSVTTYSLPSGTATYYYEAGSGYTVARSFAPSNVSAHAQQQAPLRTTTQQVHIGNQPFRFNQMMVVEQSRSGFTPEGAILQSDQSNATVNPVQSTTGKSTSSPRPSILRKRDSEGSPLKAAKNLTPMLATLPGPPSPPSRPDSRGTGQSSAGSTTISATSSPGPDESPPPIVSSASMHSTRTEIDRDDERPILEMSPRKKPRKQQLTGNDLHEPKFSIEDMEFLCNVKTTVVKEDEPMQQSVPEHLPEQTEVTVRKPTPVSLLHSYHQTWKSTHNHFLRYTDVKPKEDRRPSIMDLANQNRVLQKINGWKIYHLSTQMEDLSDLESQVYEKLSGFLKVLESEDRTDKDFDRINDLIKGNMQRSKIINEGLLEAKTQVMKIFDHKVHVADIINRCASKRNFKKREKS